ncbi:MAG: biotin/lipoyl-binding protein [Candidatus Cloacimonetes bacterium]|nr:biotin/lipoyl-binding protein [Candidatus Cloacimonadota bacterium]MBL7108151.1 biotin/lipoyl-binding protein [Candidatus Cloacimonadota bacterium]
MTLFIDNKFYNIVSENENQISVNNEDYAVGVVDEQIQKMLKTSPDSAQKKEVIVSAPMPGLIVEIEVKEGDKVSANQGIMIVEAMKMQNEMKSPKDGIVKKIYVKNGQTVNSGDSLISIE